MPEADFGISSISSTRRIFFCGETCSATYSISASWSSSSSAGTTKAFGISPASSSGTPITAHVRDVGVGDQDRLELGRRDLEALVLMSSFSRSTIE